MVLRRGLVFCLRALQKIKGAAKALKYWEFSSNVCQLPLALSAFIQLETSLDRGSSLGLTSWTLLLFRSFCFRWCVLPFIGTQVPYPRESDGGLVEAGLL